MPAKLSYIPFKGNVLEKWAWGLLLTVFLLDGAWAFLSHIPLFFKV